MAQNWGRGGEAQIRDMFVLPDDGIPDWGTLTDKVDEKLGNNAR